MCRNDKEVFEKLCELTVPALGPDVELPVFSLNYRDRWIELIQFWNDRYRDAEGSGFLFPVLHKIRYEEYPHNNYSEPQLKIFELLENEIRTNLKAHRTWVKSDVFKLAEDASIESNPNYFSWAHFEYVVDRTDCDIYDVVFRSRNDKKECWRHVYEKLVCRLFLEAANWNKMDWVLGDCILKGLEKEYGIGYEPDDIARDDDYGALIMLLKKVWHEGVPPEIRDVLEVKTCSEKLASMIWTEDTKEQLVNMLAEAVELARAGKIKANLVKESWLYRQIQAWYDQGSLETDLHRAAKESVFHVNTALN